MKLFFYYFYDKQKTLYIYLIVKTKMERDTQREKNIYKTTLLGGIANALLLIFKFIAGFIGHSSAMIADAVHSLSDFITDLIVILFIRISGKPEDKDHGYGHGKYETLATAIIGIILFFVGVGIFINATEKIIDFFKGEELQAPSMLALVAAAVSIVTKEALYQYTVYQGKKLQSKVVIANAWHHRSDAFSSIGTFIGICGAVLLGKNWHILDPIAALIVSLFIIKIAYQLSKPCIEELLEKSLPPEIEAKICETVLSFPEVSSPHHIRTRHIGNNIAIEIHIRMDGNMSLNEAHEITKKIEIKIKEIFGKNTHIGIHMEPKKS